MQNNPNNNQVNPNNPVVNPDPNQVPNTTFEPSALPQIENNFDPNLDYTNFAQNNPNQQIASNETNDSSNYNNFDYNNPNLNQGFDPLVQNTQDQYYQDPNQTYADPNNLTNLPMNNYNDPYNVNNSDILSENNNEINSKAVANNNVKKKSNLIFYVASGIAMVVLLGVIGFLAYLFLGQNNTAPKTDDVANTSTTVTQSSSADSNLAAATVSAQSSNSDSAINLSSANSNSNSQSQTAQSQAISTSGSVNNEAFKDPKGPTPASLARKNTDTVISTLFLKKYFPNDLTQDGKCKNEAVCGNGVDSDSDGLTNLEEYNYDTDPTKNDTDGDSIADGDEIKIYGTSPTAKDSDFDKYDDAKELATCYDPALKTSNKITSTKKQQITDAIKLSPLHEPTITIMKTAGATDGDLVNGYIARECTTGLVGGQN